MKIIHTVIAISVFTISMAQEAADKKIQAGIVASAGMNFTNPTTKLISRKGVGSDLTIGMNLNFNLTPTIGVNTGLEFDFESFKYKTNSDMGKLYYVYNDTDILPKSAYTDEQGSILLNTGDKVYELTERKVKPIYLTVPTMLLFRTKFIGYFRYFGKFGMRNSFLLSSSLYDKGFSYDDMLNPTTTALDNSTMKTAKRELAIYKGAVGLAGGVEWNFSGTTSLVAEIGYYYGLFNVNRWNTISISGDENKNLSVFSGVDLAGSPIGYSPLSAKQNQLVLKVSILF